MTAWTEEREFREAVGEPFALPGEAWRDSWVAARIAEEHRDTLRYCPGIGWLHWDGQRWAADQTGVAVRCAEATVRRLYERMLDGDEADEATRHRAERYFHAAPLRDALSLAKCNAALVVHPDQLDADPWTLNCQNGLLDLRSGELSPHDPDALCTKLTGCEYDPDAAAPRFERFLAEIFNNDTELITWVQRYLGYALTGDTSEHKFAVWWGTGCNGKTVLLSAIARVLGDYHATADWQTFAARRDPGVRNDLAALRGARLVSASEGHAGLRLDAAVVKTLTGSDPVTCRFLFKEHFTYLPTYKIVLVSNYLPKVAGDDSALWRRLRQVPFSRSFEGREDRSLGDTLRAEAPGILTWLVEGCLQWQQRGLGDSSAVSAATNAYREESDPVGRFLASECRIDPALCTAAAELRARYQQWCETEGLRAPSGPTLGRMLARHGIRHVQQRRSGKRTWVYEGVGIA
jgi:putative DNA primase/helicase